MSSRPLVVRTLGRTDYNSCWQAMQQFTQARDNTTPDEIWLTEHPPVYTLGQAGRVEHLLQPSDIPVVHCDRGGQVTYHGPGQLIIYALLDLHRTGYGVRSLVGRLEQAVIALLDDHGISATNRSNAPGVYVAEKKIAALGLRIRHGCTYHGISLNVDMDLEPFDHINPCGYSHLEVTQLADLDIHDDLTTISHSLLPHLIQKLGYTEIRAGGSRLPSQH